MRSDVGTMKRVHWVTDIKMHITICKNEEHYVQRGMPKVLESARAMLVGMNQHNVWPAQRHMLKYKNISNLQNDINSDTGTRTRVSCVRGKCDNHLHYIGWWYDQLVNINICYIFTTSHLLHPLDKHFIHSRIISCRTIPRSLLSYVHTKPLSTWCRSHLHWLNY